MSTTVTEPKANSAKHYGHDIVARVSQSEVHAHVVVEWKELPLVAAERVGSGHTV